MINQSNNNRNPHTNNNLLIVRFSSLGDIAQSLWAVDHWHKSYPQDSIYFLTKSEFGPLVEAHMNIQQVYTYDSKTGIFGLWQLAKNLRKLNFNIIYDAHNNLRSLILRFFLFSLSQKVIVRSKNRFRRFLLFKFRINTFDKPFVGAKSFVDPLTSLKFQPDIESGFQPQYDLTHNPVLNGFLKSSEPLDIKDILLLAPSAAWELKRWPIEYWQALVHLYQGPVFLLGGPKDDFCKDIEAIDPKRIKNLAGQLNWLETATLINKASFLISGDTGVLHLADLQNKPHIAIIGPTAFGFTARANSLISKTDLSCQPCSKDGRDRCTNKEYKKCLMEIKPKNIYNAISHLQSKTHSKNTSQIFADKRKSQT